MDAEYLQSTVGPVLSEAMTKMVVTQPVDAVEFLGDYLIDYVRRTKLAAKQAKKAEEMDVWLTKLKAKEAEHAKVRDAAAAVLSKAKSEEDATLKAMDSAVDHSAVYNALLPLLTSRVGAVSVAVARKSSIRARPALVYLTAAEAGTTTAHPVEGRVLLGPSSEDLADEDNDEEGVTFRLWRKTEKPPPKPKPERTPEQAEDEEENAEEVELELIEPAYVTVENVVRDTKVKCFGIPKLGAYLAVPVTYQTWLHPEGLTFEVPEPPPDTTEPIEPVDGEPVPEPKAPVAMAPVFKKHTIPAQMCLCFDTMGVGRPFNKKDIEVARQWAASCVSALEKVEQRMFEAETALLPQFTSQEAKDKLAAHKSDAEIGAESASAEVEGESEKLRVAALKRYSAATASVVSFLPALKDLTKLSLKPQPEILSVITAALTLIDSPPTVFPEGTLWQGDFSRHLAADLLPKLAYFDPNQPEVEAMANAAKEVLSTCDGPTVDRLSTPISSLMWWVSTACDACACASTARAEARALALAQEEARALAEQAEKEAREAQELAEQTATADD